LEETGEYDLEALFIRLNHAINSIGANAWCSDTIEPLPASDNATGVPRYGFSMKPKDKGVTVIITGERMKIHSTRQGLRRFQTVLYC